MSENQFVTKQHQNTGKRKSISYSQFSDWVKCPYMWYNGYVLKKKKYEPSIHTAFGQAIHEPIQMFVKLLYTEGSAAADGLDLIQMFETVFDKELSNEKQRSVKDDDGNYVLDSDGNKTFEMVGSPLEVSDEIRSEFLTQGKDILTTIQSYTNRKTIFPANRYECVGIELPINISIKNNLSFIGFLDIVLRDKVSGKHVIIDLKTSTRMWNKYQQSDALKLYQLLLYKAFYCKQYQIPLNKIGIEFLVLKRMLMENANFPEKRTQKVVPASSKAFVDEALVHLIQFVDECFTENGQYNTDAIFRKTPHKGKSRYSNCRYCDFSNLNNGECDRKETKKL